MNALTIDLSPHPTEAEQALADLAVAVEEWRADHLNVDRIKALRTAAAEYAANVPDWFRDAPPELHTQADRLRHAVDAERPSMTVAREAVDLLDLVARTVEDHAADRADGPPF